MKKGSKMTEESKQKVSKNNARFFLGKKRPEVGAKISASLTGKKRPPFSDEWKAKIGEARKGKKLSEEAKEKMSKWRTGRKFPSPSAETKKKMSESQKRSGNEPPHLTGEGSSSWKGGISKVKGYSGFISRRRQVRKKENGGSHTMGDWQTLKAQYNWTCPCCLKAEPNIKLTEDHIIPLSKGGSDNIENIQPLCKSCNSKKSTKIIHYGNINN